MNARLPPPKSSPEIFGNRRTQLLRGVRQRSSAMASVVISAGWPRTRNFGHNLFPFRAESHFLYLVGRHIEGALLVLSEGSFTLFVIEPDPEMGLWTGPQFSASDWERELGLDVRPIAEMRSDPHASVLPPQDEETALWLTDLLGRSVEAQSGSALKGGDLALAELMVQLRLRHDEAGLAQMRFAAEVTAEAHREGLAQTLGARSEAEIRGAMEGQLIKRGSFPAYTSIVTSHAEVLHASESAGAMGRGEMILCDVGGESPEGYAADITRTWPTGGRFSSSQQDIYSLVLLVQKEAIEKTRVGVNFLDIHRATARRLGEGLVELGILRGNLDELFESGAISVFFPHGLGHLLGLDVHDMEDLGDLAGYGTGARSDHPVEASLRLTRVLEENMVVTIEPGFYQVPLLLERARANRRVSALINWDRLSGFRDVRGIRIEDDVLVTASGPDVLSRQAPKEIGELEACLSAD